MANDPTHKNAPGRTAAEQYNPQTFHTEGVTAPKPASKFEMGVQRILSDRDTKIAYALADIVGVALDIVDRKGSIAFIQEVVDESERPLGRWSSHKEAISEIFDKNNPEREMLRFARAFSAIRHEAYPTWAGEQFGSANQVPVGFILTGQGAKDVGTKVLLDHAIDCAGSARDFSNLAVYVGDGSGRFESLRTKLEECAEKKGIDPYQSFKQK